MALERRTASERKAYFEGVREGIRLYAIWRNGVQYVGAGNDTLETALARIEAIEQVENERSTAEADRLLALLADPNGLVGGNLPWDPPPQRGDGDAD